MKLQYEHIFNKTSRLNVYLTKLLHILGTSPLDLSGCEVKTKF